MSSTPRACRGAAGADGCADIDGLIVALLWSRQVGTATVDVSLGVAVDGSGNAFITGETDGSLSGAHAGGRDAFLTKYDTDGNLLWSQ